jgi:hypothetical protein
MRYLTDIHAKDPEPLSELLVLVGIVNQDISSIKDDVHVLPIGKTFEKGFEVPKWQFSDYQPPNIHIISVVL